MKKIAGVIVRYRILLMTLILLLAGVSIFTISRTRINYDLNRYLSEDTMTRQAMIVMEEEFGSVQIGNPEASRDLQNRIGAEIPMVMGISVIIVLAMLLFTSHAWLEPAAILFTLAVSIILNMGTNFVFPDVSFITFAVSAILQLALSIDYAIMLLHTFNAYQDKGLASSEAMQSALAECFMRIASSALTTVAGLLSLLFMSFTIGFDIGIVLSKGIIVSMLCVFLLMPGIILLMEKPLRRTRHHPVRLGGDRLAILIWRIKKPLAILLLLTVLAGFLLNTRTVYTFSESATVDRFQQQASTDSSSEGTETIQAVLSSSPLILLVPGGEEDADYDTQRSLVTLLQSLRKPNGEPAVGEILAMVTTGAQALKYYSIAEASEMTNMPTLMVQLFFAANGFGESVRADRLLHATESLPSDNASLADLRSQLSRAEQSFNGPHYARLVLSLNFDPKDPNFHRNMEAIFEAVRTEYGNQYYATGFPMSTYDISNAFQSDLLTVNLITLLAILTIVMLSFRAIRLPLLLVLVIEGAIWITMGFSSLMHQSVFFISYLICLSIQMGATIDYAILLSDQYRNARKMGLDAQAALTEALRKSLPTILTSGTILVTAGYIIGRVCSIYYIASIGSLLARGAFVSVALVLTLLPSLLALTDRHILSPS